MTSRTFGAALGSLFLATLLSMLGPGVRPARADVDLNGPWFLATNADPPYGPSGCLVDVTQTAGALTVDGYCLGTFAISLVGTIDPIGGGFSATGSGGTGCAVVSIVGTASPSSDGFAGTFSCDALFSAPFSGSRCGNEVLDPGEECDPGILANSPLANPCCTASCTALPAGTSCGAPEPCRAPQCDGAGACKSEPFDAGTACTSDGNVCTDDVCNGTGSCTHPANAASCSDGNFCTSDDHCALGACVGTCSGCCGGPSCTPAPAVACKGPATTAGSLDVKLDTGNVRGQRVGWVWKKGEATSAAEFGDPTASTDYAFCIYRHRASTGVMDLVLAAEVAGGAYCRQPSQGFLPCWQLRAGRGFDFKNPSPESATPVDGLRKMSLRAGADGAASVKVKAIGSHLRPQYYAGLEPVFAQLRAANGQCWDVGYVDPVKDRLSIAQTDARFDYRANRASPSGAFLDPQ